MWLCRCCPRRRGPWRRDASEEFGGVDGGRGGYAPGVGEHTPVSQTLTEERLEEARMLSGMEPDTVRKLYSRFVQGLQIDPERGGAGEAPSRRHMLSRISSTFRSTSSSSSRYSVGSGSSVGGARDALESEEDAAVVAARIRYRRHANRAGCLTRDQFLLLPTIRYHPLRARLADMTGFTHVPERIDEGDVRGHVGAGGRRSRPRAAASPARAWAPPSPGAGQEKGVAAEALAGTADADAEVDRINRAGRRGRVKGPTAGAGTHRRAQQGGSAVAMPSVDFFTFVRRLAPFGKDAPLHAKLRASFQLYDWDDDGIVSASDLRNVLGRITRVDPDTHGPNLRGILRRRMLEEGGRAGRKHRSSDTPSAPRGVGVDVDPEAGVGGPLGVRQRAGKGQGGAGADAGRAAAGGDEESLDGAVQRETDGMGETELQDALVDLVVERVMSEVGGSEREINFQQFAHSVQLSGGDVAHQAVLALVAPDLY